MKLSAKTEYACLAMLHLAECYAAGEPVQLRRIAEDHGIPSRFLVQIMLQLKGVGLVSSTRGAAGGYRLGKPPQQITLLDVIEVMEGDDWPATSCATSSPLGDLLLGLRRELCAAQRERLEGITLADMVDQAAATSGPMWYI